MYPSPFWGIAQCREHHPDKVRQLLAAGHGALTDEAAHEVQRLRGGCAEASQVVGALAAQVSVFDDPETMKSLDDLQAAEVGHPEPCADLLAFKTSAV